MTILFLIFYLNLFVSSSALKCYTCNAVDGSGGCDDDTNFGEEKECHLANATVPACQIIKSSGHGVPTIMMRGCGDAVSAANLGCTESHDDSLDVHNCFCASDLCNQDWDTADPGLMCYTCNSQSEDCDENINVGTPTDCKVAMPHATLPACQIIQMSGLVNQFIRGCVDAESENELACSTDHSGGLDVHHCMCNDNFCNFNFDTADHTTTVTQGPPETTTPDGLQCYTCDSQNENCDENINVGAQTDCKIAIPNAVVPACQIIQMSGLVNQFIRSCVDAESESELACSTDHSGGLDVHHCMCNDNFCNFNFDTADHTTTTTQGPPETTTPDGLQCYTCDSQNENCDENINVGAQTNCKTAIPNAVVPACQIIQMSGLVNQFIRSCVEAETESELACSTDHSGGLDVHHCMCNDNFCNLNFDTADHTTTQGPPHTTQQPPDDGLQCYDCDSLSGSCDESVNVGTSVSCSQEIPDAILPACQIMKTSGAGLPSVMIRNCVDAESPEHLECDEAHEGGMDVKNCICDTNNCNSDWDSARKGLKCYSCNSVSGSCDESTNVGTSVNCNSEIPDAAVPACQIMKTSGAGLPSVMIRNCVDAESSGHLECDEFHEGGMHVQNCICNTDKCNRDWDTADDTLQCYTCDSSTGNCDEHNYLGTPTKCDEVLPNAALPACQIIQSTGVVNRFVRNCADAKTSSSLKCDSAHDNGLDVTNCLCSGSLCNKDFDTAGDTIPK